jgi:crotonyl-CoA reductase
VFVASAAAPIVTCAATSGYMIEYDNRHLWMKLKRIVELALRQLRRGVGRPTSSDRRGQDPARSCRQGLPLEDTGEAAYQMHHNLHEGKIGVLCLAPEEGLGIDDPEFREQVGEDKITAVPPPRRLRAPP